MGLIGGIARTAVVAGTWTAVSNSVSRRQAGRWAAEDQSQQPASRPPAYTPPPPGRYQRPMFQQPLQHPVQQQQPPMYDGQPPAQMVYVQAAPPPQADAMTARLTQL